MDVVQTLLLFAQPLLDTWVGQQPHHGDQSISSAGGEGQVKDSDMETISRRNRQRAKPNPLVSLPIEAASIAFGPR